MNPTCNAHASDCHLWAVGLYSIFPHYLLNGMIFGKKKLLNIKCVFHTHTKKCFVTCLSTGILFYPTIHSTISLVPLID